MDEFEPIDDIDIDETEFAEIETPDPEAQPTAPREIDVHAKIRLENVRLDQFLVMQ